MARLLKRILNNKKSESLQAGMHENVYIKSIDISDREFNGAPVKRNCFIKFVQIDTKTKKPIGEFEAAWFKFDYTSEYTQGNILEQVSQLISIMEYYVPSEVVDEKFTIFDEVGITSVEDFINKIETKETVEALNKAINSKFFEVMEEFVGPYTEDSVLLRLKLVTDKTGQHIQIPAYGTFVESMKESNMVYVPTKIKKVNTVAAADM